MKCVTAANEPATFDQLVRVPGVKWLTDNSLLTVVALPKKPKIPNYWRLCLDDLMSAYDEVCAYASLRISPVTGGRTVEHFAAKSSSPGQAYEWTNYRLVCSLLNARKNKFDDVLDPFTIAPGTYELNAISGGLKIAPHVTGAALADAQTTLTRLGLDGDRINRERRKHINRYISGQVTAAVLQEDAPFVHDELVRQGIQPA